MWEKYHGTTVYPDSNVVIFAIERGNKWTAMLRALFEAIERGRMHAVTSEVTLAEVLVKPIAERDDEVVRHYEAVLAEDSPLVTVALDRSILRASAQVSGRLGVKLIDAIHVATAIEHGCGAFLSNDIRLGRKLDVPRWRSLDAIEHET
jgi:predicted nucleic acid-binding protein